MEIKLAESNVNNSVKLEGSLTVERAAELKSVLVESLSRMDRLHLVFENVTEVDISFLQLLCAAHHTAARKKKKLTLDGHRPELLRSAVAEAGFVRQEGCAIDVREICIWKEGWS